MSGLLYLFHLCVLTTINSTYILSTYYNKLRALFSPAVVCLLFLSFIRFFCSLLIRHLFQANKESFALSEIRQKKTMQGGTKKSKEKGCYRTFQR